MQDESVAQKYRRQVFQPLTGAVVLLLNRNGESQAFLDGLHFPIKDAHEGSTPHPKGE